MKRNWFARIGVVSTCVALFGIAVQAKADDVAEIRALEARLVKAVNARDLDGVMAAYMPDDSLFVFDVVPPRQYVGYKAYRDDCATPAGTGPTSQS